MKRLNKVIYASVATALLISTGVMAASVGTMNTFSSGTAAVANDVNANFSEQTTQINDNDTRISTLENNSGKILMPYERKPLGTSSQTSYEQLDIGKEYIVMGIIMSNGYLTYLVDDLGIISACPYQFFEILVNEDYTRDTAE